MKNVFLVLLCALVLVVSGCAQAITEEPIPEPEPAETISEPAPDEKSAAGLLGERCLLVGFIPAEHNEKEAEEFSCVLVGDMAAGKKLLIIKGSSMQGFRELFSQEIRKMPVKPKSILIRQSPFPGENALLYIKKQVRNEFPRARIWEM